MLCAHVSNVCVRVLWDMECAGILEKRLRAVVLVKLASAVSSYPNLWALACMRLKEKLAVTDNFTF